MSTDYLLSVDEIHIIATRTHSAASFTGLVRFHFLREGVDFGLSSLNSEFRVKLNHVPGSLA